MLEREGLLHVDGQAGPRRGSGPSLPEPGDHERLLLGGASPQRRPQQPQALAHQQAEVDLRPRTLAPVPITTSRPWRASCSTSRVSSSPLMSSRTTSYWPLVRARTEPAHELAALLAPRGPRHVDTCRYGESGMAAVPTPPAAPLTSSRSPGRSSAWVKSASCAVANASMKPPAARQST